MSELNLVDIKNYYQVTDLIASSGQPTKEQFKIIFAANYDVVINLALPNSDNALVDEGAIVTGLGLVYIHIPIVWDAPTIKDVQIFFSIVESIKDSKVWVHCAMNKRVSCLLYLYRKYILQLPEEISNHPMKEIWQPTGVWQKLIEETASIYT